MQNVSLNHQRTIIRRTEDELLTCKDPFRIEKLQSILRERRLELQKMERQAMNRGVLL